MTKRSNTRRRFLALSGSATMAGLAGCMDELDSVLPNGGDGGGDGGSGGDADSDEYGPPELQHETEYDSREEFAQPGESFDDFEDADQWELASDAGEVEVDEDVSFEGSQSLRLTAENDETVQVQRSIDTEDFTDTDLSMAVRTTTPDNVAIDIRLIDSFGGWAHHQVRDVEIDGDNTDWFRTCPGVFEEHSQPLERDSVDAIEIMIHNTGDAEVWVDDLRTHDKPDKGYVMLSWDDGFRDYYDTALPLHEEYDVNGVQAVVRNWTMSADDGGEEVDTGEEVEDADEDDLPVMSLEEVLDSQDRGEQIVAHGYTHQRMANYDEEDLRDRLSTDKQWAVNNELEGGHYIVYPHNSFDQTVLDVAPDYYYAGGFNQAGDVNLTGVHGFDPLALPRTIAHDLDTAKECVDKAAEYRQCTILNFHAFDLDNTLDEDEYEELLEHIDETEDIEVIDFDDLWTMRREGH